jgi:hypothetical protein
MELLDRYLNAVRFWLPPAQQDDIIAELGDDIRTQIEEREATLGRTLDDDDVAAILKQRGHPMLMASRYLPQRSLIGPVLYPAYVVVLRIVLLWVMVPVFVLIVGPIVIATAENPTIGAVQTVWNLAMAEVFTLGVVTLVFAILERRPLRELETWDPRKLPYVPKTTPSLDAGKPIPRATAIADFILGVVFTGVWLRLAWYRAGFDLDVLHVTLAPVWNVAYGAFLLTCLGGIALGWTSLVWPSWIRLRSTIRIVIDAVTVGAAGVLASAGTWWMLTSPKISAADLAQAAHWASVGMKIALAAVAIVSLIDVFQEARRFFGARQGSAK